MSDLTGKKLNRLAQQLDGRLSMPGDDRYAAATAIWAKPAGRMPCAVAHCQAPKDVQAAIRAARDSNLSLSVRGGGHDWAGRALCGGLVIDLSSMNAVTVDASYTARISGGARASDVLAVTDPLQAAAVAGAVGAVGYTGFTLGGGYGALIGRFGLALDNLIAAEVVLADGRVVAANNQSEEELFWALRGGGGNFGVVTTMHHRVHDLPSVRSGALFFPFAEAKSVFEGYAAIAASAPDELSAQLGLITGPDGVPVVMIVPTWCGVPEEGEARLAQFFQLGTLIASTVKVTPYGASLTEFDKFIVNGKRELMETCWIPALNTTSIEIFIEAMERAASPGCAIFTHEFKGAASRVQAAETAFGLRRDHILIEILATFEDRPDAREEWRHQQWAQATLQAFNAVALPGGYPNLLGGGNPGRAARSYGPNAGRLIKAKRRYDPDNIFSSAIPLPVWQ